MHTASDQLGRTAVPVPLADAVALSGFPRPRHGSATSARGPAGLSASPPTRSPAPCPSRIPTPCARLLVQLDGDALDQAIGAFLLAAPPQPAQDSGRSLLTARPCVVRAPPPPSTSPRRDGPHRSRPGPASGRRREQRDSRLPASSGQRRPDRHGDHRGRAALNRPVAAVQFSDDGVVGDVVMLCHKQSWVRRSGMSASSVGRLASHPGPGSGSSRPRMTPRPFSGGFGISDSVDGRLREPRVGGDAALIFRSADRRFRRPVRAAIEAPETSSCLIPE